MTPRLWTIAVKLTGPSGLFVVRAAIDTGATTSLMPPDALLAIGCDPMSSTERVGIVMASGREHLALVRIPEIFALGHRALDMKVMSHSLPSSSSINGLLGMDFLLQLPDFQKLDRRFQRFFI